MRRRNNYHHWLKLQRRYRRIQARLITEPELRLKRKLDIIARKLQSLNYKWKLGISTAALSAWLAYAPAEVMAQGPRIPNFEIDELSSDEAVTFLGYSNGTYGSPQGIGDFNGDGLDDFIVLTPYDDNSYVVFTPSSGFSAQTELTSLDGSNGFTIANDYSQGISATSTDINGDGLDDLVIGSYRLYDTYYSQGRVYVIFGTSSNMGSSPFDLDGLSMGDGSNGFIFSGNNAYQYVGASVSGIEDINGDDVNDLIIGAYGVGEYGVAYVLFGDSEISSLGATLDAADLSDGSNGFTISGSYSDFGDLVVDLGDFNGDGISDVGVYSSNPAMNIVFGNSSFGPTVSINPGTNSTVVYTDEDIDLAGGGDINNDGFGDLVISDNRSDDDNFASVIFGSSSPSATIETSNLNGSNGFELTFSESSRYDLSLAVGDVNGDNFDDIIFGASEIGSQYEGSTFIVLGSNSNQEDVDIADLDGSIGFSILGGDYDNIGYSVGTVGDTNGDGLDDILIFSYTNNETYLFFGTQGSTTLAVFSPIADQQAREDKAFSFMVPTSTFSSPSASDNLMLSATLEGGAVLPAWLTFDSETNTLSGTPPNSAVGDLMIEITASFNGSSVSDVFKLTVEDANSFPSVIDATNSLNALIIEGETIVPNSGGEGGEGEIEFAGFSVSAIGDFNGDGVGDFLITEPLDGPIVFGPSGPVERRYGAAYLIFGDPDLQSPINLDELDGSDGVRFETLGKYDMVGIDASGGDVNGDGLSDVVLTGYDDDNEVQRHYVVFGKTGGFSSPTFDLNSLFSTMGGSAGFIITNASGSVVDAQGDINADGINDIILGDKYEGGGSTSVIFGQTGFNSTSINDGSIDLSTLTSGSNGFEIDGTGPVAHLGDVNGDNVGDFIVGATDIGSYGGAYIIFGKTGAIGESNGFDIATLSSISADDGFIINTTNENAGLGESVSGAGDVNGDGINDIVLADTTEPQSYQPSTIHVIFGRGDNSFGETFSVDDIDGSNGFNVLASSSLGYFGESLSSGDVNGDGLSDLIIGSRYGGMPEGGGEFDNSDLFGGAFVVFGTSTNTNTSLNASSLDGSNGFQIKTDKYGAYAGISVAGGDINGDGVDDIIIGDPANKYGNASIVIFGSDAPASPELANSVPGQSATEDEAFSFAVPENTFSDSNANDIQTLSASGAGGTALPAWLNFDPATRTFEGTPLNADVGSLDIELTNTDEDDLSVTTVVNITVANTEDAPILETIGNQEASGGTELTFTAVANDGDQGTQTLEFSIDDAAEALGMSINSSTGEFSWTPSNAQQGDQEVTITVSDGVLDTSETITITVDGVTGIEDDFLSDESLLYPNPVRSTLNISVVNDYVGTIRMKVVNLSGQLFMEQDMEKIGENFSEKIDATKLYSGIYLLEIQLEGRTNIIQRFIKE